MLKKKLTFIGVLGVIFLIQACGKKDMHIVDQNSDVTKTAGQEPKEAASATVDDQDEVETEVKIEESEQEEFAENIEQDFVEQISFKYYFKETSSHYIALYDGVRCVELHYKNKKNNDFWTVTLDRYPKSYKTSVSEYLSERCDLTEIVKGDSLFCASGITSSEVLKGIIIEGDKFISETLVTHKNNNFKEIVKSINSINE